MKIGRNAPCPCGSGNKYKKCCQDRLSKAYLKRIPKLSSELESSFDYIQPVANKIIKVIKRYNYEDAVKAVFCFNLWRRNRSALAQCLSLNMALFRCSSANGKSIKNYSQLKEFYGDIMPYVKITNREDYTIDDFGEIFINHLGKTYPIITGTGHILVYSAIRFMQTLTSVCGRDDELRDILEYLSTIIDLTREHNIPRDDLEIAFELPSEAFWNAVTGMFDTPQFKMRSATVSQIMGCLDGPIEMRHFVVKEDTVYPLFNTALLVDYYKLLLSTATREKIDQHMRQTILNLVENTFNFAPDTPMRMLIEPAIIDHDSNKPIILDGILFAGVNRDAVLIAIDGSSFDDPGQISEIIRKISAINGDTGLRLCEKFIRGESKGCFGIHMERDTEITYMIIDPFTDITTQRISCFAEDQDITYTALDVFNMLGFSRDIGELIAFLKYHGTDPTRVVAFGGTSGHFFAWKKMHRNIYSGAVVYGDLFLSYNETEEYIYTYFKNILQEFPRNGTQLFTDPLNWIAEESGMGYTRFIHRGCSGFGGDIKALNSSTYVFLAHNSEFFTEDDITQSAHSALCVIDDLNQRLFDRYAAMVCNMPVLSGKTLQLLYMPWHYAEKKYAGGFLDDPSKTLVYSDEFLDTDSVIIRYAVHYEKLLDAIKCASNRRSENTYFAELLLPLRKYSPQEYDALRQKLADDEDLKKTVGVFEFKQEYYYSDRSVDTEISAVALTQVRKEIANVCFNSGVQQGEYHGKEANRAIRKMQTSVVAAFEKHLAGYDQFELHKRILSYYAIQQNAVMMNARRYHSFDDLDDEVQTEFQQKTREIRENHRRYAKTAEYLLESNLAVEHPPGAKECTKEDFIFLLAFADWLVVLQDSADICHFSESDVTIAVDYEYKIDTLIEEEIQEMFNDLLLRKYVTDDYEIKGDVADTKFVQESIDVFYQDTGVDLMLLLSFLEYMALDTAYNGVAAEIYPNVFVAERTELEHTFKETLENQTIDPVSISALVDFLTLNSSGLKTVDGKKHDILPIWEREKRDNRFNVKPIINHDGKCVFSPVTMYFAGGLWKNGILEWYPPYEIGLPKLTAVLKAWKKRYEDEMVQDIKELFCSAMFDEAIPEVDLSQRFPKEGYPDDLGDYDIMAIHRKNRELWIIESKVLHKVGSVFEDQMLQKSFFFQHKYDEKFQRRIDYIMKNISKVLASFGITEDGYKVVSYMVTNKLFASRYKKIKFPIITYSEMKSILEKEFTDGEPYLEER